MSRLAFVALVIAPLCYAIGTTPAAAYGCCRCGGYGYYGYTSAPYYYRPRAYYGGYFYRPWRGYGWGWRGYGYRSGWGGHRWGWRGGWRRW